MNNLLYVAKVIAKSSINKNELHCQKAQQYRSGLILIPLIYGCFKGSVIVQPTIRLFSVASLPVRLYSLVLSQFPVL